nr:MAG TPA: hypothetical protein [Caudoviricetes sp.]
MYLKRLKEFNSDNLHRRSPGSGGLLSNHVRYSYGHSG